MQTREQGRLQKIYTESRLKTPFNRQTFAKRLFIYQNERVPIVALSLMGLVLYAGVGNMIESPINWGGVLLATVLSTLYFIQVRLADEPKDFEHDSRYHSGRPVQRGLVTLSELRLTKRVVILLFLITACLSGSATLVALAIVQQACAYITHREFYVREWLRRHFFAYQFSHYIQLLLLGWLTTTALGITDPAEHLLYYGYILAMSIPIELSRTIGGIDNKKAGDRYSHKLGAKIALAWFFVSAALVVIYTIILAQHGPTTALLLLVPGLFAVAYSSLRYAHSPVSKNADILGLSAIILYFASAGTLTVL